MQEEDKEQRRNLMLFFIISVVIMLGYPYLFGTKSANNIAPKVSIEEPAVSVAQSSDQTSSTVAAKSRKPEENIETTITIDAPRISGTISTRGLRFNDIILKDYKQKYDDPAKVNVFGDKGEYRAFSEWGADGVDIILPDETSCWKADVTVLAPKSPVVFTWDNGNGLLFIKKVSIDENYVFTVKDSVRNYGSEAVKLRCVSSIQRTISKENSESLGFYQGPIGYFDKKLQEVGYSDILKKKEIVHNSSTGGWFGITDKYWLVSFIPAADSQFSVNYEFTGVEKDKSGKEAETYAIRKYGEFIALQPSEEISETHHLFIGAKEIQTLDMYEEKLHAPHLDLVIDFGYLYILTKPLLYLMSYAKDLVGNMGLGILLITLLLKLLLLPLANKSYRSMNKMKMIQPKMKALQQKYANDQMKMGQAISELYKKEKVNPMGGCLPLFLQWPILFALYKVLYISIEMRQAPFIGWIHDLSIADPWPILTLGGLIPVTLPGFLQIGIWPLLMGLSMWLQQKMGPAPADPAQEKMMLLMPVMFTFMFSQLPSGLIIYWTFSNLLAIAQQYYIMKHEEAAVAAAIAEKK